MTSPHPDPTDELPHPLDGKLEPETKDSADERAPLYSIAISLKRIADRLDAGLTMDVGNDKFHELTNLAWEMGRSFRGGAGL